MEVNAMRGPGWREDAVSVLISFLELIFELVICHGGGRASERKRGRQWRLRAGTGRESLQIRPA